MAAAPPRLEALTGVRSRWRSHGRLVPADVAGRNGHGAEFPWRARALHRSSTDRRCRLDPFIGRVTPPCSARTNAGALGSTSATSTSSEQQRMPGRTRDIALWIRRSRRQRLPTMGTSHNGVNAPAGSNARNSSRRPRRPDRLHGRRFILESLKGLRTSCCQLPPEPAPADQQRVKSSVLRASLQASSPRVVARSEGIRAGDCLHDVRGSGLLPWSLQKERDVPEGVGESIWRTAMPSVGVVASAAG